jgi:hypothetical protein
MRATPTLLRESPTSTPNTDRHLLFGILAFQNNFISREQLLAAFNAWVLDKTRSLGDILIEHKALIADRRALLDVGERASSFPRERWRAARPRFYRPAAVALRSRGQIAADRPERDCPDGDNQPQAEHGQADGAGRF